MADITLIKGAGGILFPADQQSAECIAKLKLGDGIKVKFAKYNNAKFHAKIFALANLAYEAWEPSEVTYKGEVVAKNFDQFRDDLDDSIRVFIRQVSGLMAQSESMLKAGLLKVWTISRKRNFTTRLLTWF